MSKFNNKFRIQSTRLKDWDYGCACGYFITICTKDNECFFGDIRIPEINDPQNVVAVVETQDFASLQQQQHFEGHSNPLHPPTFPSFIKLNSIPQFPPGPAFQIPKNKQKLKFPSFIHTHTEIGKIAIKFWQEIPKHFPFVSLDEFVVMPNHLHGILFVNNPKHVGWNPNKFGPQSKNLGSIIRGYKTGVKMYSSKNEINFKWHPRYYDSIIRNEFELERVRKYIINNPKKWFEKSLTH